MQSSESLNKVDMAIHDYYKLKQEYFTLINRKKKQIQQNKTLTTKQKQRKIKEMEITCIHCGQKGGTLFHNDNEYLIATCNAVSPCNLNIKINRGTYINIYDKYAILKTELSQLREKIISIKLNIVYNLDKYTDSIKVFSTLKKELGAVSTEFNALTEQLMQITNSSDKQNKLNIAENDLHSIKKQLHDAGKELRETNRLQYAKDMVELYLSMISPLVEKIREIKFDYSDVYENSSGYMQLQQSPYTLQQLLVPISNDSNSKIITFVK